MIEIEKAIARLDRAAKLKQRGRHINYQRTIDLAADYTALATGQDYARFLVQFKRREDDPGFVQRELITIPKTPSILKPALAQFQRLSRLQNIRKLLTFDTKEDAKELEPIKVALDEFYGEEGIDEYLSLLFDWVALIDPGAFVALEFEKEANTIKPWGVIYWSSEVYEWGKNRQKQLNYLLVEENLTVVDQNGKEFDVTDYLLYAGEYVLRYSQMNSGEQNRQTEEGVSYEDSLPKAIDGYDAIYQPETNGPKYLRQRYETKLPFVQAYPLGYLPDLATKFETYVSPIEPARLLLVDHLRTGSNFDLTKYLHTFPQRVQAVPPCPGENPSMNLTCNGGFKPDGSKCGKCGGSGLMTAHTQPMDTLEVSIKDLDKIPELSKLIVYVQNELRTFDALKGDLADLSNGVYVAIFNNELVPRQSVVASDPTATEIGVKRDDINNTLMPFGKHKAATRKFLIRATAVVVSPVGFDYKKLGTVYDLPKDLKPVSTSEIYADLKAAIEAEAPAFEIEQLIKDLAEKRYEGDPEGLRKYQIRMSYIPFMGLSWAMVQYLDAKGYIRKRDMVLLAYQDSVFSDLERSNAKFYEMKDTERTPLINTYIDKVMADLPAETLQVNMGKVLPLNDPQ
ncbi:hypothetical protein [Spirosoma sp.]|uniref:hypothetical protein n=1 Tax=Spirosoma sp. TaxID=1899569 RepID=UPI0026189DA6|nr:hypothetical protein [Spirosoma sp.]MCX6218363.1 hypothetical protein [Spirosoma sp.]